MMKATALYSTRRMDPNRIGGYLRGWEVVEFELGICGGWSRVLCIVESKFEARRVMKKLRPDLWKRKAQQEA